MWCHETLPLCLFDLKPFSEVSFLDRSKRDKLIARFEERDAPLYVRVICPYAAEESSNMAISVEKGEILQVVEIVSDEWWECRKTTPKGGGRKKRGRSRKGNVEKGNVDKIKQDKDVNESTNTDNNNVDEEDNTHENEQNNNNNSTTTTMNKNTASAEQGFVPCRYLALLVMDSPSSPTPSTPSTRDLPTTVLCSSPDLLPSTLLRIQNNDPKLRGLSLTRCCVNREWLEKVTSALWGNTVITNLDLSHNGVQSPETALPSMFKSVQKNLRRLVVAHCSLIGVPSEVTMLESLRELHLNNNILTGLPSSIGLLTNLEKLDLSFNKLEAVPEQLHLLKSLEELNMSHNKLTDLPSYLLSLKKLKSLLVAKNPVKGFPKEVVERGNEDLINFMSNMLGGKRFDRHYYLNVHLYNKLYNRKFDLFQSSEPIWS